jgi:hypothetical protein
MMLKCDIHTLKSSFIYAELPESKGDNPVALSDMIAARVFVLREFREKLFILDSIESIRERYIYISDLCEQKKGKEAYKFGLLKLMIARYGKSVKNIATNS